MSISITQVQSGCYYAGGPGIFISTKEGSRFLRGVIGPFAPNGNIVASIPLLSVKDSITTGDGNRYGDKSCQHIAWSGSLSYPGVEISTQSSLLQPCFWMQGTNNGIGFSHWLSDGDDFTLSYVDPFDKSYTVRMAYKSGVALVGYYLQGITREKNKAYVKKWSYFSKTSPVRAFEVTTSYPAYATLSMLTDYPLTWDITGSSTNLPTAISRGATGIIPDKKKFLALLGELVNLGPDEPQDLFKWGDLAAACADQRRFVRTNTLQYLNDLQDVTRLLPQLGKLDNPKTWAKFYLWWKYSFSTNIDDTLALTAALKSAHRKFRHELDKSISTYSVSNSAASNSVASATWLYHYKLTTGLAESRMDRALTHLDEWGLNLNTEIAWDFVPYSFVVDWFTGLDSLMRDFDSDWRLNKYPVLAVCRSTKHEVHFNSVAQLGINGLSGSLSYKCYTREIGTKADTHVCRIDSPRQFKNYLEAAALLISKSNWR